jgi:hypothetical protein
MITILDIYALQEGRSFHPFNPKVEIFEIHCPIVCQMWRG